MVRNRRAETNKLLRAKTSKCVWYFQTEAVKAKNPPVKMLAQNDRNFLADHGHKSNHHSGLLPQLIDRVGELYMSISNMGPPASARRAAEIAPMIADSSESFAAGADPSISGQMASQLPGEKVQVTRSERA
jgi:hypothetical protein